MIRSILGFTILLLCLSLPACYKEVGIPVTADFVFETKDSLYTVPVNLSITNRSIGATHFKWTFEGGDPATSEYENPGTIVYKHPGTYNITLEAWNEDERQVKTSQIKLDSSVTLAFDTRVLINEFSPVTVKLINNTIGAISYDWTFEDGTPATFSGQFPPDVTFTTPGAHTITLKVNNGGQEFITTKTINVKPALTNDFIMEPSFEDEDFEAPLIAILDSKAANYLTQQWSAPGGIITNDTATHTTIRFQDPGTYTVTLTAENGKASKTVSKTIEVKPNTGFRTHTNIKLGISAAHATIGSLYSTKLRQVFKKGDDLSTAGQDIDIAFFGLNGGFSYNKFVSPDSASFYAFTAIPGATTTRFINNYEECGCSTNFTVADFDAMTDDTPLRNMTIPADAPGGIPFSNNVIPRLVFFQTADGRKGAIKIKSFVNDGTNSFIIIDIKIQKQA